MSNENEEAKIKYEKSTHNWALQISVVFTDKGVTACIALENIDSLLQSYVYEAGCEIMSQLLHDEGWDIGGRSFIEMGGW